MSKSVLIVGGAGYIGSHMVQYLGSRGYEVVTVDNLSTGHADAVTYGSLIQADLNDEALLSSLFSRQRFDLVMHFAASAEVAQSVINPALYYQNNVVNSLTLLNLMLRHSVKKLVFSSTCAVYGQPNRDNNLLSEDDRLSPINPYGRSKLMIEQILADYQAAFGLQYISLRYFNAAGADWQSGLGERHSPESHLIPNVIKAAMGLSNRVVINGVDYPTEDGSCVRDYVHIIDLCTAHEKAAIQLINDACVGQSFNLGSSKGSSVKEVIQMVERVSKIKVPYDIGPRRVGDPPFLVADFEKARRYLQWTPKYGLKEIVESAWAYHTNFGFEA